jgi:hypothetical protein
LFEFITRDSQEYVRISLHPTTRNQNTSQPALHKISHHLHYKRNSQRFEGQWCIQLQQSSSHSSTTA